MPGCALWNGYSDKLGKIHVKVAYTYNFIKRRSLLQMFSCEFCEIFSTSFCIELMNGFFECFWVPSYNENLMYQEGIFYLFHACDIRTHEAALFQNIFKFCTFLPKFSNILPFFAFFWPFPEKSHVCPYFLE